MSKVITLTTDFGRTDSYVAQMKGVIISLYPQATIVDLTHEIPACDILAAARFLQEAAPMYPAGTIHVAVVDPGVGGQRRRLITEVYLESELEKSAKPQLLVGPDNGIFSLIAPRTARRKVWQITRLQHLPSFQSGETFEGRNIFAPVAALLAAGHEPSEFGSHLESSSSAVAPMEIENFSPPISMDGIVKGQIVYFDHFGNAATNISKSHLGRGKIIVNLPRKSLTLELRRNFEEFEIQSPGCIINSQGFLEIVANRANAREILGLKLGDSTHVTIG